MNIMKKRNIFLGLVLMLGLTGCYDLDKMPEGVLSTTIPFASTGEMRNAEFNLQMQQNSD